jgi:2-iminobutanoate/2-iminopropanoate deaminase
MKDLSHFDEVNRDYSIFFNCNDNSHCLPPARATVEVSRLPKDADIEMDAIAVITSHYVDAELY